MAERARQIEEEAAEPEPGTEPEPANAGGVRPPGRIGAGLFEGGEGGGPELPPFAARHPLDWWGIPVEDLKLSKRGYRCLKRNKLKTVGEIVGWGEWELLSLPGFGEKQYDELRWRFHELGIMSADRSWRDSLGTPW